MRRICGVCVVGVILVLPGSAMATSFAQRTYNQEWKRVRKYLGQAGQPPPVLHVVPKGVHRVLPAGSPPAAATGGTVRVPDGRPEVYLPRFGLRKLGKFGTNLDRKNLDHELDHTAQRPDLWDIGEARSQEHGAYKLAKAISRSNPQKRKRAYNNLGDFAKFGQFGLTKPPVSHAYLKKAAR